ncbi:MAG: hypothetical protein U5J99_05185 [Parvularculaceae bacterium]|nr:hypothetical protein [Parvularculaceae bacterium]
MSRAKSVSVEELFKQLGETPMSRKARADSLFRRLRETEEDEFLGTFIRAPKTAMSSIPRKKAEV